MHRRKRSLALFAAIVGGGVLAATGCSRSPAPRATGVPNAVTIDLDPDEEIIFFRTSAHLDDSGTRWVVPIHGWIYEPEHDSPVRAGSIEAFWRTLGFPGEPTAAFDRLARPFIVDNESNQSVAIRVNGERMEAGRSGPNGHFTAELDMHFVGFPDERGRKRPRTRWMPFTALTRDDDRRTFRGEVQRLLPEGLTVISDIDDTVKISAVHDHAALLQNTFIKPYRVVDGMAEIYRDLEERGAAFHYVSASPWQLYQPLVAMLDGAGFPKGSMHLKAFRWKDSSVRDLFAASEVIKTPVILELLDRYPRRRVVLIGDAGEADPEIYAALYKKRPKQIIAIGIRVPDERFRDPQRFAEAFSDVPESIWFTFEEASELAGMDIGGR